MRTYDVIVIGTGGVGSAALHYLAQRGLRAIGFDPFLPAHDRGSSHGQTRIIRKAYFEHPDYVPLLRRSYELWNELEIAAGEPLLERAGLVQIGAPDGLVVRGVLASARRHQLDVELWDGAAAQRRIPGFTIPEGYQAVYERDAGYLLVERCVLAHLRAAQNAGAELRSEEPVGQWQVRDHCVTVQTAHGTYQAPRLVVAAGPWAASLLAEVGLPLRVLRKHLHWFACPDDRYHQSRGCPTFLYDLPEGCFYGFPCIDEAGLKVAEHSGGSPVDDPLRDPRQREPDDDRRVRDFLARFLPGVGRQETRHAVCFYTMSPDHHFWVDRHPAYPEVCFAAGLSGHGFKFAAVLGEILADFVQHGASRLPVDFLSLDPARRAQAPS